jgi:hypothetical protein
MENCYVHRGSSVTVKTGKNKLSTIRVDVLKSALDNKKINKRFLEILTVNGFSPVILIEEANQKSLIKVTLEDGNYIQVSHNVKFMLIDKSLVKAKSLNLSHVLFQRKKIKQIEEIEAPSGFQMFSIQMKSENKIYIDNIAIQI